MCKSFLFVLLSYYHFAQNSRYSLFQGPTVPAVREESEEVVLDCAKIVQSNKSKGLRSGSVSFIRINPKDAEINISTTNATQMISIFSKAESALKEIDLWIELLQN